MVSEETTVKSIYGGLILAKPHKIIAKFKEEKQK
jgi:hypothetical protein